FITMGADGTMWCPFDSKKFLNESLITFAVNISSIYLSLRLIFSKKCAKIACFYYFCRIIKRNISKKMRKVYYIYNPQTQTYDRIYATVRQRAL
ncbi:hypothetical protein NE627_23235, partial [Bacteroides caccae]|nr:hypothetical protein [Bacteroides caccae]